MPGYLVNVAEDCPHTASLLPAEEAAGLFPVPTGAASAAAATEPSLACNTCGDPSEVWMCLCCAGATGCSRFVAGHAKAHAKESGHSIALGVNDGSAWCFVCELYLDTFAPKLQPFLQAFHQWKFGEASPAPGAGESSDSASGAATGGGAGSDSGSAGAMR